MALRTVCPLCQASYYLADEFQDKRVRCPCCRKPFWVAGTVLPAEEEVIKAELADDFIPAAVAGLEAGHPRPRRAAAATALPADPAPRARPAGPLLVVLAVAAGAALLVLAAGVLGVAGYFAVRRPALAGAGGSDPPAELLTATSLPAGVLQDVKDATVFVKVDAGNVAGTGSGFVIKAEGASGYVVTNHHVITPPPDDDPGGGFRRRGPFGGPPFGAAPRPTITLVFRSGTRQEGTAGATVLLDDAARDLAVLQVTGFRGLPRPIPLIRQPQLVETMPVFLFGFPFGDALGLNNANPAVTVGKGSVSSLRRDERGEVARIQIDGDLNPGNSGGPVVDARGRLVGVAVAKVRGTQIGLAIPPDELIALLESAARR